jgi:plastocyanin
LRTQPATSARALPLLWWIAAAALLIALALALVPAPAGAQGAAAVSIRHHMFMPAGITVPAGATVTWTNEDGAPHTVTSDARGLFGSGWKLEGGRFSFTFTRPGTYPYHCSIHRQMHGVVVVTGG